jgi:hypothetical protein
MGNDEIMGLDLLKLELGSYLFSILLTIVSFIFKGIAVYTMAKRRGFKRLYVAFIPFLNFILIGKLIGNIIVWGKPLKNLGLWVCIFAILEFVVGIFYSLEVFVVLAELILGALTNTEVTISLGVFQALITPGAFIYVFIDILYSVISLAKIFFDINLMLAIFRLYRPQSSFLYAIVSIFFEFMFGFFLFSLRNVTPTSQEEYYRNMARSRGYYYYEVKPKNTTNGYNSTTKDEDPFEEFSDKKSTSGGENDSSGDSDDLFD